MMGIEVKLDSVLPAPERKATNFGQGSEKLCFSLVPYPFEEKEVITQAR